MGIMSKMLYQRGRSKLRRGGPVKKGVCVACKKLEGLSPPAFKSGPPPTLYIEQH